MDARPVAVGVGALLVVCALSLRLAGAPDAAVVSLVAPAVILVAVTEWLLARKHLRRDVLVARVTALATGGEPLQRILDGVLDELAGEGFGAGSIGLPGADGVELVATSAGADPRERERRLALCRAAIGRLAERSPLVVNDVARDRGPELWSGTARGRVLSVAAVPVPVGQDAVGVLAVHSTVPRRFPQDDVHLFEAIGAVVGGAVMRAAPLRLANEQLRRRVHELTGLQESARALAASLDIDTVVGEVLAAAT
ncbi:MAG TPA: GAF domain-containing protein, partial [Candidatus Dormibacteraeota bacterium]|nr:GAF domain-containing protein [Candidatus Dormibacteraeota bacterium]